MVEAKRLAGRYRLEHVVATGGMGTVYSAFDERLGRKVAIKLLKDGLASDPQFVERFRREARAVAALSHPNIANVFDYGEDDDLPFMVMEYVNGRDLAHILRDEKRLGPERAALVCAQVCDALAHAHAGGVIHRDVKPANIILGEQDRVKVTDFGIARALGQSTLTGAGSLLGTAYYVSPEHAGGDEVGFASDIYSLGIVLYELLTGWPPFAGDSPVAVAMRHVTDEVPPPSAANPAVPPALDAVVARATAKRPVARYGDALEMAEALRAFAEDGRVPATTSVLDVSDGAAQTQTVWPIPGDRWNPERIGRIVIAALLGLALIAALLLVWRMSTDDPRPARRDRAASDRGSPAAEGFTLAETIVGSNFNDVKEVLESEGFEVEDEKVASELPKDTVVSTDPDVGSVVEPGQTITLYVSEGPEEEEEEVEDDGEVGKGHGKGKAKGHD